MILSKRIKTKINKKHDESINEFLTHIYKELKVNTRNDHSNIATNQSSFDASSSFSSLKFQLDSNNDVMMDDKNDSDSLYTAKNSDSYLDTLKLTQNGFFLKTCKSVEEFEWECSVYLTLMDHNFIPQIMFANKSTLEICYDTRNLVSLRDILKSYNTSKQTNESSFSLFLHDLFSFILSINPFIIHNNITPYNIFYDMGSSKFYITDLKKSVLLSDTNEYVSDTSSMSSSSEALKEYSDMINVHSILTKNIEKISLLKLVNRIFICYIPVNYTKLCKKLY